MLRIQLLGRYSLRYGGEPVTAGWSSRLQSLLGYLVIYRSNPQSRRRLAFLFWPESTEHQAFANLRNLIYRLRRALPRGEQFLIVTDKTVQWKPDSPFTLDAADFENAITRWRRADGLGNRALSRASLEEAVAIYRGDLLQECYDDWVWYKREQLRQEFIEALERLILLLEEERAYRPAIRHARRLIREEPLRETSYRHLMRLYGVIGDKASALQVYQMYAEVVRRELSAEPGPAIQELYNLIVESDSPESLTSVAGRLPIPGRAMLV